MIRVIKVAMPFVGFFMVSLQASAQDVGSVGDTIFPACVSAAADSDGDGFGFENNRSCIVAATGTTMFPTCVSAATDSDGDGFGFENSQSCIVVATGTTAFPTCASAATDSDGDGFGFENNQSCIVAATGTTMFPTCVSAATDSDGDGFGFENNQSCIVVATGTNTLPTCVSAATDSDGDGFGFENNRSCIVAGTGTNTLPTCVSAATDSDGDGFGFENNRSCIVPATEQLPSAVQPVLGITAIKTFQFSWEDVALATIYRLLENADGVSGFSQVGQDIQAGVEKIDFIVALYKRTNASYIIQSCNGAGCVDSDPLFVSGTLAEATGYIKASNSDAFDRLGTSVSLSADGSTLAIGAANEDSSATGINGDQADNSARAAGAVYVFTRNGSLWEQQAYIKASNSDADDRFGFNLSLSADGNTLAVGADSEESSATGINGDQTDNSSFQAGAAYVFIRTGSLWEQQAYVKASNTDNDRGNDSFGGSISLSADGKTLAIGAFGEGSSATGINGDQADNSADAAGAVYVFTSSGSEWVQQAYIKASNTDANDGFGVRLSLSADGNTLAVGAFLEASGATGINGDPADNSADAAGAVYIFTRSEFMWEQQAYVKASNADSGDNFGSSLSLSADGNTLAVGAAGEDSSATGVNGDLADNTQGSAGAVYIFTRSGPLWEQQAYVKASNADSGDNFGSSLSLSADGNTLAVVAADEDSSATGINGDQADNTALDVGVDNAGPNVGAVYLFTSSGSLWEQLAYVKASNTDRFDKFGHSVSLSADGNTLAVGAIEEDSVATGVNGDQTDNSASNSGAIYLY